MAAIFVFTIGSRRVNRSCSPEIRWRHVSLADGNKWRPLLSSWRHDGQDRQDKQTTKFTTPPWSTQNRAYVWSIWDTAGHLPRECCYYITRKIVLPFHNRSFALRGHVSLAAMLEGKQIGCYALLWKKWLPRRKHEVNWSSFFAMFGSVRNKRILTHIHDVYKIHGFSKKLLIYLLLLKNRSR